MFVKLIFALAFVVAVTIDSTTAIVDHEAEFIKLCKKNPEGFKIMQKVHANSANKCMNAVTVGAITQACYDNFPNGWAMAKAAGGATIGTCLPIFIEEYKKALKDNNYGKTDQKSRSKSPEPSKGKNPKKG